jgi:hypothetical protein
MRHAFAHLRREGGRPAVAGLWTRRVVLALFTVVVAAALLNAFGQRPATATDAAPAATLTLRSPERVRGGLFFQSRVDVVPRRAVQRPRLVLSDGWPEGMQVNSIEPAPSSESSRDGRVVLTWNALDANRRMRVWFQFEVNPTNVGHRDYTLEFDDGDTALARVRRTITVFP